MLDSTQVRQPNTFKYIHLRARITEDAWRNEDAWRKAWRNAWRNKDAWRNA